MNPFRGRDWRGGRKGLTHRSQSSVNMRSVAGALTRHASCPGPSPGSSNGSPGFVGSSAPSTLFLAAMRNSVKTSLPEADDEDSDSEANTPKVTFSTKESPLANGANKHHAPLPENEELTVITSTQSTGKEDHSNKSLPIPGVNVNDRPTSGRLDRNRPKSGLKLDTSLCLPDGESPNKDSFTSHNQTSSNDNPSTTVQAETKHVSPAKPKDRRSFSSVLRASMSEASVSPGPSRSGSPVSRSRSGSPVSGTSTSLSTGTPPPGTPAWPRPKSSVIRSARHLVTSCSLLYIDRRHVHGILFGHVYVMLW